MIENQDELVEHLKRWQEILRLRDWDIRLDIVRTRWRKTGDIKIDRDDRKAVLLINGKNPRHENLEEVIIHELLHLKLYEMDQMIESLLYKVYGDDEDEPRFELAYDHFMIMLESTVEDLTKGYLALGAEDTTLSFGRLEEKIQEELEES